jgi:leader peptidase (prepilin peptidase)/N-methyltransferase
MLVKTLVLLFLALCAYYDLKSWAVPVRLVAVFGFVSVALCLALGGFASGEFLLRLMPGAVFLLLAFLTREAVGYGDGLVLLPVCLLLEMKAVMIFVMLALLMCAAVSLPVMIKKKGNRQTRLPFMPFLLASWEVIILWS